MRIPAIAALLSLAACAHEPPPPPPPVRDDAGLSLERARQEQENREVAAWREAQKAAEGEAGRAAEGRVQVQRLDDLARQKAEAEARALAEAEQRDRAAEEARAKVARARDTASGAAPASAAAASAAPASAAPPGAGPARGSAVASAAAPGADPDRVLARRRADKRWSRPALSGQLCQLRSGRDAARKSLAAEERRAARGVAAARARAGELRAEVRRLDDEARKVRARLRAQRLDPLPCSEKRTRAVARCFQALDAGRECGGGPRELVDVARSFDGAR